MQIKRTISRAVVRTVNWALRSSLENPATPLSFPAEWALDIFNGGRTDSGIRVSALSALQASVVFACVDLIASTIASLPLSTYERLDVESGGYTRHAKTLATDNALFEILRCEPNDEMSAFTFKKTLQVHALLWGNAYAEIERDKAARIVALWPLNPYKTRPHRLNSNAELVYLTTDGMGVDSPDNVDGERSGTSRLIKPENIVHLPGLSLDGRIGQNVVELARNAIGLSLATEKYASKFFANGAAPLGILTHPGSLKPEDREITKRSWQEAYGGENRHRTALLENGLAYQKIGSDASEAQMIEARKQQWMEIAPIFHVNPAMLGINRERGSNAEQIGLEFVNYTIGPWLTCWEDELKRKLFRPATVGRNAGRSFFAKFDTRKLTLPDAAAKKDFYSAGRQWGFLNANDIREMEDMNPIPGGDGDAYWMPVNEQVTGSTEPDSDDSTGGAQDAKPNQETDPGAGKTPPMDSADSARRMFYPVFRDAVGRFLVRENPGPKDVARIFKPAFQAYAAFRNRESEVDSLMTAIISCTSFSGSMLPEEIAVAMLSNMEEMFN